MQVMHGNVFLPPGAVGQNGQINQTTTAGGSIKQNISPNGVAAGKFTDILAKKLDESEPLQFSKHAEQRLRSRDITLTSDQMQRAMDGVNKAKIKGIRDSLVLVDDVALVINTKSKTVITALEGKNDSVFTNIDGAVIV